jgi:DNA-binding GntR family transcriptional regulator
VGRTAPREQGIRSRLARWVPNIEGVVGIRGLQTVSVVDALITSLRGKVLDGQLDAGIGLTETDVATEYEVSRPTAKTAINQLVQDGLLRREAHKSARVPSLSRADVEDLFLVRMPLELEVVRLVAGHPVPQAAADAVRALAEISPDAGHSEFVEADLEFHNALVRAVASPRLSRLYQTLSGEIHLSMVQSRHALGRDRIVAEHGGILGAIREGDAAQGQSLMRAHLEGTRDALAEQFDSINAAGQGDHRAAFGEDPAAPAR